MKQVRRSIALFLAFFVTFTSLQLGSIRVYAADEALLGSSENTEEVTSEIETGGEDIDIVEDDNEDVGEIDEDIDEPSGDEDEDEDEDAGGENTGEDPDQPEDEADAQESLPEDEASLETSEVAEEVAEEELAGADSFEFYLDANGGTFGYSSKVTIEYEFNNLQYYRPTKNGYVFAGWYFESSCINRASEEDDADMLYSESIDEYGYNTDFRERYNGKTLFAKWSNDYCTVTFHFGNETGTDPLKDTGYYWDQSDEANKKRIKSYEVKVAKGSKLSTGDFPKNEYVRNADPHYTQGPTYYENEDRTAIYDTSAPIAGDTDIYVGYVKDRYVVTFHAGSDTAYFDRNDFNNSEVFGKYSEAITRVEFNNYGEKKGSLYFWLDSYIHNTNGAMGIEGFYDNPECTGEAYKSGENYEITGDMDLYIKWESKYKTLTLDPNGGYFLYDYDNSRLSKLQLPIKNPGKTAEYYDNNYRIVPNDLHKCFMGWADSKTATKKQYGEESDGGWFRFEAKLSNADKTLYAVWSDKYNVFTFHTNGGEFTDIPYEAVVDESGDFFSLKQEKTSKTVYINDINISRDGYTFGGWYTDEGLKNPASGDDYNLNVSGDMNFYAKWNKNHTVTFNFGEGTDEDGKTTYSCTVPDGMTMTGASQIMPVNPASPDENKAFKSWYKDAELKEEITRDEIMATVIEGDTTFYAGYAPAYTVTFEAMGGTFTDGTTSVSVKVPQGDKIGGRYPNVKTEDDTVFRGWFAEKTGASVKEGTEVKKIANYVVEDDVTFYAGFAECYIITFHANKAGVLLDGKASDIKVKVIKGEPYRYGKDTESRDAIWNYPQVTYGAASDGQLPVFHKGYNCSVPAWATNAGGTGNKYYFDEEFHRIREGQSGGLVNMGMEESFVPTHDMDFYLVWADPVKVNFKSGSRTMEYDGEGESGELSADGKTLVTYVAKGTSYDDIHVQYNYRPGNNAEGSFSWGYADSKFKTYVDYNKPITAETTVYGKFYSYGSGGSSTKWTKLIFHAEEGYFGSPSIRTRDNTYHAPAKVQCEIPVIDDPAKAFSGWYTDKARTKKYDPEAQGIWDGKSYVYISKAITNLYAGYTNAKYVTFDANGGYFDDDTGRTKDPSQVLKDGNLIRVKEIYAGKGVEITGYNNRVRRDGNKIFGGWYTDEECTKKAALSTIENNATFFIPTAESTILYAKWVDYTLPTTLSISSKTSYSLAIGATAQLSVKVTPEGEKDPVWKISSCYTASGNKKSVQPIILTESGKVIATGAGTAFVYAELNGVQSDMIMISVSTKTVSSSISLDVATLNLVKNESAVVTATVVPETAAASVKWTTANKDIATVEGNGATATIAAGGKAGSTTVTATVGKVKATVKVNVAVPIRIQHSELVLTAKDGAKVANAAIVTGDGLSEKEVTWSVDNPAVVSLDVDTEDSHYVLITPNDKSIPSEVIVELTASVTNDAGETYSDMSTIIVNPVQKLAAPKPDVDPGTVKYGTKVQLFSDIPDVNISYKIGDGSYEEYKDPIEITDDITITAIATKQGYKDSLEAEYTYTVSDDFGDIPASGQGWFYSIKNVPTGIWYLIDGCFEEGGTSDTAATLMSVYNVYTGSSVTFDDKILVFHGTDRLVQGRDYTIKYANNKNASNDLSSKNAPSFTITGKGNYTNKKTFRFMIAPERINNVTLESGQKVAVAAGPKAKLSNVKPVLTYKGTKLVLGKDYTLKYYKDKPFNSENEVQGTELIDAPGKTYYILAKGLADSETTSNFFGSWKDERAIEVVGIDSAKATSIGGLKAVDAKGKAIKVSYDAENAVDVVKLFDNSEGKTATAFIKDGKKTLTYGDDYTVEAVTGDDYKSAGTHSFKLVGVEKDADKIAAGQKSYIGERVLAFQISGVAMKSVKIAGLLTTVQHTGAPITIADLFNAKDKNLDSSWTGVTLYTQAKKQPKVALTMGPAGTDNVDVTYSMLNSGNAGKFTLKFTGHGKYVGTISKTITVKAYNVKKNVNKTFVVDAQNAVYSKAGAKPSVIVTFNGMALKEGVDYTVSYKNNKKVVESQEALKKLKASARPTVIVKGKGNFTGANASATFLIAKKSAGNITLSAADVAYNAKGKKGYFLVTPKLSDNGKAVTAGKNKDVEAIAKGSYVYTYAEDTELTDSEGTVFTRYAGSRVEATDKVPAGTRIKVQVTVKCSAKSNYSSGEEGTKLTAYYRVVESGKDISKFTAGIKDLSKLTYSAGEAVVPVKTTDIVVSYKVKGQKTPVILDPQYYEVVSVTGNRKVGTATVVLRGRNGYGGTKTFTFKIGARKIN